MLTSLNMDSALIRRSANAPANRPALAPPQNTARYRAASAWLIAPMFGSEMKLTSVDPMPISAMR